MDPTDLASFHPTHSSHDTTSACLPACLALLSPLAAQSTLIVDGTGALPGYRSITAAAQAAVAGDTIRIKGMTLLSGEVVAYSETTYMFNLPESFPIDIPPGVTVEPLNSTPVVVWTTALSPPVALFDLQPTGSSGPATVIRGITFVGGQVALRFEGLVDDVFRVIGDDIKLAWNQIGVQAIATDGQFIDLDMNDCQVRDDTTTVSPGPVLQAPRIGLQFHAVETAQGSDPPHIVVDLDNLTTSGTFATMDSGQPFVGVSDLGVAGSRLIEVWIDDSFTPEYTGGYPNWQRRPFITSVVLTATGGIWDGGPDAGAAGWDVGLYANTKPSRSTITDNYTGAYEVTLSGVTARRFRLAGIHAGAWTYTRGQLFLKANSVVRGTGFGSGGAGGMNGIHLYELEGYLAFHGVGSDFLDNLGSGIYANADATLQGSGGPFPMGLYLDMRNSDIHGNARHGMELRGAVSGGFGSQGANIGGTWDWDQQGSLWLMVRDLPVTTLDPDLGYGPGSINRCRISNNGKAGIDVQVRGTSTPEDFRFSAADFRVVNSYIWNNPEGGIHGRLDSPFDEDGPYYLVPVLQSTLAGNGESVGWNLEIEETQSPNLTKGFYRWTSQSGPGGTYVETKVRESILQRKNHTDNDIGNYIVSLLGVPDGPNVDVDEVGIDGVRSFNLPAGSYNKTTTSPTPFTISPPNWSATDLALAGLELLTGGALVFYESPTFWETFEEETGFDYSWDPRPSVASGTRDKGPEEVQ